MTTDQLKDVSGGAAGTLDSMSEERGDADAVANSAEATVLKRLHWSEMRRESLISYWRH
jgi:hypothetical protein